MSVSARDVFIGPEDVADSVKRFVVLHSDGETCYYLLLNSNLTERQKTDSKIGKLQIPLAMQGRKYLTRNCFLSCEKVHSRPVREIEREAKANVCNRKGQMSKSDFDQVRALIFNAGLYSLAELEVFDIYEEDFE
jgi:hypothetical protein